MKIAVIGVGFVGLSNAILLSQKYEVVAYDINQEKVDLLNNKKIILEDDNIKNYLTSKNLNIRATINLSEAIADSSYAIISMPTNYNEEKRGFDTYDIENMIEQILLLNNKIIIIIKSTLAIGFTERMKAKFNTENIVFVPEFLREGNEIMDNLTPSRIVIGDKGKIGKEISKIYTSCIKNNAPILFVNSTEAESIKLFSNSYLAMRISFFNELDTFSELNGLNSYDMIKGICLDPRVGEYYNNPSFGYGGYCLPKDTKQLLSNFDNVPNTLINGIIKSNEIRINFIVERIIQKKSKIVGIYRLVMKTSSNNFRQSVALEIIKKLKKNNIEIIIYEPLLKVNNYYDCKVIDNLDEFKLKSNMIVANRIDNNITDVKNKIYSRDIFNNN